MNLNLRFAGFMAILISLVVSGCSQQTKAFEDAQGDLQAAYRQSELGNTQDARKWVDLAIKADPNDANLYTEKADAKNPQTDYTIAIVFAVSDDIPSMVLYMRKAAQQFPSEYVPLEILVENDKTNGDTVDLQKDSAALVKLLQAELLLPSNSKDIEHLSVLLANAYCCAGNAAMGVQRYHNTMLVYPSKPDAFNGLAYYYAETNDKPHLQEALADANKSLALTKADPDLGDEDAANVQDTIAWIQYRMGDYADAEENSELSVDDTPSIPDTRYHLAMIYEALGKTDAAKVELSHALLINPSYADAIAATNQLNNASTAAALKTTVAMGTKAVQAR